MIWGDVGPFQIKLDVNHFGPGNVGIYPLENARWPAIMEQKQGGWEDGGWMNGGRVESARVTSDLLFLI